MKKYFFTLFLLFPMLALCEPVKYADRELIESSAFDGAREIMISLPKSYSKNASAKYPVIYTVRGQVDLLGVVSAIDMLAAEVPEFIVVGISGTGSEFIPSKDGSDGKYSKLLHDEVVPHINQNYRTAPIGILVGHSAAGKFVMNDWLSRGDDFSAYYAISPELHNGAINDRVRTIPPELLSTKKPMLLSMGNEDKRMQSLFEELETIEAIAKTTTFIRFENQTHMSGRVNTVMAGLRNTFSNWRPSRKVESGKFDGLRAHYQNLGQRFGYDVAIPLETMKRESAFHLASEIEPRWQVAEDIIDYAITKSSINADEFLEMADEMVGYGMEEGSKRMIFMVCNKSPAHKRCVDE